MSDFTFADAKFREMLLLVLVKRGAIEFADADAILNAVADAIPGTDAATLYCGSATALGLALGEVRT